MQEKPDIQGLHGRYSERHSEALVPPKPKEFVMAMHFSSPFLHGCCCACTRWRGKGMVEGSERLRVGGKVLCLQASAVNAASVDPAPPSMCPRAPLVDETKGRSGCCWCW